MTQSVTVEPTAAESASASALGLQVGVASSRLELSQTCAPPLAPAADAAPSQRLLSLRNLLQAQQRRAAGTLLGQSAMASGARAMNFLEK